MPSAQPWHLWIQPSPSCSQRQWSLQLREDEDEDEGEEEEGEEEEDEGEEEDEDEDDEDDELLMTGSPRHIKVELIQEHDHALNCSWPWGRLQANSLEANPPPGCLESWCARRETRCI